MENAAIQPINKIICESLVISLAKATHEVLVQKTLNSQSEKKYFWLQKASSCVLKIVFGRDFVTVVEYRCRCFGDQFLSFAITTSFHLLIFFWWRRTRRIVIKMFALFVSLYYFNRQVRDNTFRTVFWIKITIEDRGLWLTKINFTKGRVLVIHDSSPPRLLKISLTSSFSSSQKKTGFGLLVLLGQKY